MDDPETAPVPPAVPRGGNALASPLVAGALAALLVALVAAIVLLPGILPVPAVSPGPGVADGSAKPGVAGGSAAPAVSPNPSATASPSASFIRPTPTPMPTFRTYVVRPGDSLNSIADAFLTSARSLAWWNRGTYANLDPQSEAYDPGHIEPGWILVVMPTVIVDEANPPTPSPGPATPLPTAGSSADPAAEPSAAPGGSPPATTGATPEAAST